MYRLRWRVSNRCTHRQSQCPFLVQLAFPLSQTKPATPSVACRRATIVSDKGLSNFSNRRRVFFEAAMKVPSCTVSVKPLGTLSTSPFPPHMSLLGSSPDAARGYLLELITPARKEHFTAHTMSRIISSYGCRSIHKPRQTRFIVSHQPLT